MSTSLPRSTRRQWLGALVAGALCGAAARWAQAQALPPEELRGLLPGARLSGQGRFRYFGLAVYDARLWRRDAGLDWIDQPLALELQYQRALSGRAIAERSLDEMQRQGPIEAARAREWLAAMAAAFPDVEPGDRLLGLHQPGRAARFFHNGRPTRAVEDAEFGPRFFAIWLSPQTSAPQLRRALLGEPAPG